MSDHEHPTDDDALTVDNSGEETEVVADEPVEPITDQTGEELGEVSGGGEVTDLGGDSPSS